MTDEQDIVARLLEPNGKGIHALGYSPLINPDGPEAAARIQSDAATIAALREQLAEARGEPDRIVAWLREHEEGERLYNGPHVEAAALHFADAIAARAYVENTSD